MMRRVALRFASRRPSLATSGRRLLCSKTPSDSEPVSVPFLRRDGAPEGGEKGGEKGGEEGESLIRFGDDEESEDGEAEPKSTAEPAERLGDGRESPSRLDSRLLLPLESEDSRKVRSSWQSRAGMVAAAAGVGVLGWNHAPALLPYGPDVVGAALVVGGLGAAASARSRLGGSGGGGGGGGAPEESALEVTVPRDLATGEGTGVMLEVVPQYAAQVTGDVAAAAGPVEAKLADAEKFEERELEKRKALQMKAAAGRERGESRGEEACPRASPPRQP